MIGYSVAVGVRHFTVWANAKTKMPVRIEVDGKDEQGRNCEIVIDRFTFGTELKPTLFDFWVPASYKLTAKGAFKLPVTPEDLRFGDLVLTPAVGLGAVKFGMTAVEVEKLLGKPDEVDAGRSGDVVMGYYASRGFSLHVIKQLGAGVGY